MISTYLNYQILTRDLGRSLQRVEQQPMVQRETEYYLENITKVTTAEEFVNDYRLFNYAMRAHGLEDMAYAKAFMLKALEEGVSDPDAFANKLTDKRYAEFVRSFNFEKHGTEATTYNLANKGTTDNYLLKVIGRPAEADLDESEYYAANIGQVKSIDDLLANERLLNYALEAVGLEHFHIRKDLIRQMLEGGVADVDSPAYTADNPAWVKLVSSFNFVELGEDATIYNPANQGTVALYLDRVAPDGNPGADDLAETDYYSQNIGDVKTIDQLLADGRLLSYALQAFELEDQIGDKALLREMLEGGASRASSPANTHENENWARFVGAFDFYRRGADATTYNPANQGMTNLYLQKAVPAGEVAKEYLVETEFYAGNIGAVKSIDQFLQEERLLSFALRAYGLEGFADDLTLIRRMLEGGIKNAESPANTHENEAWADFVEAFNFAELGEDTTTYNPAQQPAVDKFIRQTLEQDAGQQNEGVRLALYFERMGPGITNAYAILADEALSQVVRTALGIPPETAQIDIDKQARLIESKLDFADFQDPEKLSKFINRFTTLWDIENPSSSAQSSIAQLFQPIQFGISPDTLMAIANLKR